MKKNKKRKGKARDPNIIRAFRRELDLRTKKIASKKKYSRKKKHRKKDET